MVTALRREREREELREKILAAARTLMVEGGMEAVTMREVARRVEYSPAALYQHFADKETLIAELCRHDFAELAGLFMSLSQEGGPMAVLARAGAAYLDFARDFPEHYRFMFLIPKDIPPDSEEEANDPARNAYVFLHSVVEHGMAAGLFREEFESSHDVAQLMWAVVHGTASLSVCRPGAESWVEFRPWEVRARTAVRAGCFATARTPEIAEAALLAAFGEDGHG
jgi:AcrR family transcriptional regulator